MMTDKKMFQKPKYLASFSRRGARKASPRRARLQEELLPKIDITKTVVPDAAFYQKYPRIWLEIGYGSGEHLAAQADKNPDVGFIGCEIFENGITSLLRHIDEKNLQNVRLFRDDARLLLEQLPDHSLERIFILFPDPWPKKKHHKRRLISDAMLGLCARVLKPGGQLRLATDHMPYARWMLVHLLRHKDFSWQAREPKDWLLPPPDHFTTRYEKKRKTGDMPLFLGFNTQSQKR